MILVSLLNDIKLKIHIGHLTLATDFADFNIWLISNFGRLAAFQRKIYILTFHTLKIKLTIF